MSDNEVGDEADATDDGEEAEGTDDEGDGGEEPTLVMTTNGPVQGQILDGVRTFRGIPYAAPPVGALRFAPTEPHPAWEHTRSALEFGPVCPQHDMETELYQGEEDCLSLNLWAPADDGDGRPVMVWIHGGAFTSGAGSLPVYDGAPLVQSQDVVLVTFNYRLGNLGYIVTPELLVEGGGSTGNFGMRDQLAALEWVQDNIASFGGDPTQVTIFGESAGVESVTNLMGSPAADGLYASAIIQSGGSARVLAPPGDPDPSVDPLAHGAKIMDEVGCTEADDPLDCLRGLPAMTLASLTENDLLAAETPGPQPILDGELLSVQPQERLAAGEAPAVPLLIGFNAHEMGILPMYLPVPNEAVYQLILGQAFPEQADALADYYTPEAFGDASTALATLLADTTFVCPALELVEAVPNPAYLYRFSHTLPGENSQYGSFHALDVPYTFGNLDALPFDAATTADDELVANFMMDAWGHMAREGAPGGSWSPWAESGEAMDLDASPAGEVELGQERCALLTELGVL